MTLHAAWKLDEMGASAARVEFAMIKYFGAGVLYNVIDRALQVHGSLGYSSDLPLEAMYRAALALTTALTRCADRRSPAGPWRTTR
jgi:acyl-CoA dehydrogenase